MWTRLTDDCQNYDLHDSRSHVLLTNITGQRYTARVTIVDVHGAKEITYAFDIEISACDWATAKEKTLRKAHAILSAQKSGLEKHIEAIRKDLLAPAQTRLETEMDKLTAQSTSDIAGDKA